MATFDTSWALKVGGNDKVLEFYALITDFKHKITSLYSHFTFLIKCWRNNFICKTHKVRMAYMQRKCFLIQQSAFGGSNLITPYGLKQFMKSKWEKYIKEHLKKILRIKIEMIKSQNWEHWENVSARTYIYTVPEPGVCPDYLCCQFF